MNSHIECEQFDIKCEEDFLVNEIKTEPQDIKNEMNPESEECYDFPQHFDIKHEIKLSSNYVSSLMTTSEVTHKEEQQKNMQEDETSIAPVMYESCDIYKVHIAEEKCVRECNVIKGKTSTCRLCKNVCLENNHTNMVKNFANEDLMCMKCSDFTASLGNKTFSCYFCSRTFSEKHNLATHIRRHTGEKPFSCDFCSKSFSDKSNLINHRYTHTGEKPFSCNISNKSFSLKSSLTEHINVHKGEKPFTYSICNSSFSTKCDINHVVIHTGERPFICDICNMAFSHKSTLSGHKKIHLDEKRFTCIICSKSFKRKLHLVAHTRCHSGEKPYSCAFCNKSFAKKCDLVCHTRTHTGEKPFSCHICNKSFARRYSFLRHTRCHMSS